MPTYPLHPRLELFPSTTTVLATTGSPSLAIAGCDLADLAQRHGTPLYLLDQATLDQAVNRYRHALTAYPGSSGLTYAGKAFLVMAMAQWAAGRGLWVDCTGVGELAIAAAAGVPRHQVLVHGVNKGPEDLCAAGDQAGTIVVDNLSELVRLGELAQGRSVGFPRLWLRFRPSRAVVTHAYTQTGQAESKFGMNVAEIREAAALARQRGLALTGLHFHLGSHFSDYDPLREAMTRTLDLAAGLDLPAEWTLCAGGGLGVAYHEDDLPGPSIVEYVQTLSQALVAGCQERGLALPRLWLEPGRSLVAQAGVALYRLGAVKQAGPRRWLLLDGGLADNPRPALYQARYTALPVHDPQRPVAGPAWLAGPYCESGDVLIEDLPMAALAPGELIAVPVSGAYHLSMASNYNGARRPAVLWLADGNAWLVQAREAAVDLVRRDRHLVPVPAGTSEEASKSLQAEAASGLWFARYHALGNDYLLLDRAWRLSAAQVQWLCDRRHGPGGDGLLLPQDPPAGTDFALRILNPDGSEAETSGNGLRIYARHLWDQGRVGSRPFVVRTAAGPAKLQVHEDGRLVTAILGRPTFDSRHIPIAGPPRGVLNETIVVAGETLRFCGVSLGNPHAVVLRDGVTADEARRLGPLIEGDPRFPRRTNVQFLQVLGRRHLRIEIWERGVGYTMASGSSACAAAAVAHRLGLADDRITVDMPGGSVMVEIDSEGNMALTGPVSKICEGTLSMPAAGP